MKKLLGIFVCMLLFAIIPLTTGTNIDTEGEEGTTYLSGIICFCRPNDPVIRAIWVHYRIVYDGSTESGWLRFLQKIIFPIPAEFVGYLGKHYLLLKFDGIIEFET